jgi:hypothetical protein
VGACSATFYCSAYTRGLNRFTHGMSMCASAGLVDHETEWVKVRVSDDAQPTHRTVTPLPGAGVDSPFRAENLLTYRVDKPERRPRPPNRKFAVRAGRARGVKSSPMVELDVYRCTCV